MNRVLMVLALVALLAAPALAREFTPYSGSYDVPTASRADIELEYDGGLFYGFGTSPNWMTECCVIFEMPAGGPYTVAEARYYLFGTQSRNVRFYDVTNLFGPPAFTYTTGPSFTTPYTAWPPADWTTVDVTGMGMTAVAGDLLAPGLPMFGSDGLGLAYAYDDFNPGHSWDVYAGGWTDDTYVYGTDDGIRLGLNTGPVPADKTSWGEVKDMFR